MLDIDLPIFSPSKLSSQSLCFAKQTQGSPYQATFREKPTYWRPVWRPGSDCLDQPCPNRGCPEYSVQPSPATCSTPSRDWNLRPARPQILPSRRLAKGATRGLREGNHWAGQSIPTPHGTADQLGWFGGSMYAYIPYMECLGTVYVSLTSF